VETYSQQDEYDKLKEWWKNYGVSLIVGVVIGIAILFGYKYWTQYQERQRQTASMLYEEMQASHRGRQADKTLAHGERLIKEFSSTPYAGLAALLLARQHVDAGDREQARLRLEWALKNATHAAATHAARLRLARLLAEAGDADGALKLAETGDKAGFEAEYSELRGDLLVAKGRRDEARAAYRDAMKGIREATSHSSTLRLKLEDLGPETAQ
jgi:predicted negative regulator of RcsB-dependent stress response